MAELRRGQQRRRKYRRGGLVALVVIVAVVLAIVTSGGSHKKKVTTASHPTTTLAPLATLAPLSPSALDAALVPRAAPALSAKCNAAGSSPSAPTTTVAAKGNAVSIVPAPAGIGFPKLDGSSPRYTKFASAPPFCINVNKTYTATMVTDAGTITIELLPKYAPLTVNNLVFLAGYHYFDGTVFHRVIQGFVDQGGDPLGSGTGGPGYSFADELPKSTAAYDNGALAMANSGANTNGSQFFIVVGNGGSQLSPASYSMFGQVTKGLSVAKKINDDGSAPTNSAGTPKVVHKILKVTITES